MIIALDRAGRMLLTLSLLLPFAVHSVVHSQLWAADLPNACGLTTLIIINGPMICGYDIINVFNTQFHYDLNVSDVVAESTCLARLLR